MIYNEEEIKHLREGGKRLARVLDAVEAKVGVGVTTGELDELAEKLIREGGDIPAFLNYRPGGGIAYPATLCTSVNDEIVHGVPSDRALEDGDIIGIDLGLQHNGLFVDMARTIPVGNVSKEVQDLIDTTRKSLKAGIAASVGGARMGDMGHAIEALAIEKGYGVTTELSGHGVGHHVHEDPYVPNFGTKGKGLLLKPGMVLALEPMFNLGGEEVILADDGLTFKTRDGSLSAHFEHTILITEGKAEVLTVT